MNIKFLETFLSVVRFRSFRLAADAHNISQAAVSNRVAALEEELGCRLFDRTQRDLPLTAAGSRLIAHANTVLKAYDQLKRDVSGDAPFNGVIRMGAVGTFVTDIIPRVSKAALLTVPGLRLSLYTSETVELIEALRDSRLDLVIARADQAPPQCDAIDLCTFSLFWIAACEQESVIEEPLTPADLATMRLISYSPTSRTHQTVLSYLQVPEGVELSISHSDSLATMISFLKNGLGAAPIPAVAVLEDLLSNALQILPITTPLPDVHYSIYVRKNQDRRAIRAVISLILQETEKFCMNLPDHYAIFAGSTPPPDDK